MSTTIPRPRPPRERRLRDIAIMAALGLVLLFAVIGLFSAGLFASRALTPRGPAHPSSSGAPHSTPDRSLVTAHAQATHIIATAQAESRTRVHASTSHAHAEATAIVGRARRQATAVAAAARTPAPGSGAAPSGSVLPPAPVAVYPTPTPLPVAPSALSGVPSAWKVVAYNATFGAGSGVGTITVTNRGSKTYTGVARVHYARGGSASAFFTLAPGVTRTLPLSGSLYPGGGYTISVVL